MVKQNNSLLIQIKRNENKYYFGPNTNTKFFYAKNKKTYKNNLKKMIIKKVIKIFYIIRFI